MRRPKCTRSARLLAMAAAALAVWLAVAAVDAQGATGRSSARISELGLQIALVGHERHVRAGETVGVIVELAADVAPEAPWRADSIEIISGACGVGAGRCPDDQLPRTSNVSRSADPAQFFDASGTWLELPSGLSWEHNNRPRLDLGRGNATLHCADRDETGTYPPLAAGGRAVATCVFMIVNGATREFPVLRVPEGTPEGDLVLAAEVRFAPGMHGGLAIGLSNAAGADEDFIVGGEREYFDTYTLRVRNAPPVGSVDFSWSDGATEGVAPSNGSITAALAVTNSEGDPAHVSQLRSVVVTTAIGGVRADESFGLGAASLPACAGGRACVLDDAQLDSADAAHLRRIHAPFSGSNPAAPQFYSESNAERGVPQAMEFVLRCGGAGGFGDVTASAVSDDGTLWSAEEAGALRLICGGETIRLANVPQRAYSVHYRATDGDDLDLLRVPIRGEDVSGRNSGVPEDAAATVRDGDGALVRTGARASVACADANRANCNALVRITSEEGLPTGDYELAVRSAALPLLAVPFHVSGAPSTIEVTASPAGAVGIGQQVRIEAVVADADGWPVADGTTIDLADTVTTSGPGNALVHVVSDKATVGGRAMAVYVAVLPGSTVLTATSGTASLVHVIRSSAGVQLVGRCDAADLTSREPGNYATWFGAGGACTASELLDQLSGTGSIFLWNSRRWLLYAEVDGQPVPGASDFAIEHGDTLFIAG